MGDDIDGEAPGDFFGISVALSSNGTILAVGAQRNDGGGVESGSVRVYVDVDGAWIQRGDDLDGLSSFDQFGSSVALSADGSIVAGSARFASGANGTSVRQKKVYQWNGGMWKPMGQPIDGPSGYVFGAIALSADGTVLVAGFADSFDDSFDGHVQVFAWTGGNDLDGSSADEFGRSISLSSDGSILACGGTQNYGRGVFRFSGSSWIQYGSSWLPPMRLGNPFHCRRMGEISGC